MELSPFFSACDALSLPPLTKETVERLTVYAQMLSQRNKVMNLTAVDEPEQIFTRHFADSLALYPTVRDLSPRRMIDVGCGGGFPGLPLKLYMEQLGVDTELTLLDATQKKIDFLDEVCRSLSVTGVHRIAGRAEDLAANANHREAYDLALSRAVASLPMLSELCLPFVKVGGLFAPHKSVRAEEELAAAKNAIRILGGTLETPYIYRLGPDCPENRILHIRKKATTPSGYPRAFAKIKSRPL